MQCLLLCIPPVLLFVDSLLPLRQLCPSPTGGEDILIPLTTKAPFSLSNQFLLTLLPSFLTLLPWSLGTMK